ncbi:MAG: RibD family protein [Candidatus Eremiobacteraeota bacterium]|nr:RibD family protein [Candidatus Eremiobacteraeota bacterium]
MIEPFARAIGSSRPYVTLKMAASLDGFVAPQAGPYWLTGTRTRELVRELRYQHDAVMIGAGTARVDDPQLTVRPPHARAKPYERVIVCEDRPIAAQSRVLAAVPGYARTIVLAPAGARDAFRALEEVANCLYIGSHNAKKLDLGPALTALKDAGITSVLCEGGPTLASALLAAGLVDRLVWLVAPVMLRTDFAIPALAQDVMAEMQSWNFEGIERSGDDLILTARLPQHV